MKNESSVTVRHIVMFKFKSEVAPNLIREVESDFAALPGLIPEVRDFEWGTDVSVENASQGYTHVFMLTFDGVNARDRYLVHPEHVKLSDKVTKLRDKVLVFDYLKK